MGEGSRGTLCFVRRASLTKRRCQFVDGMRRETEETGVLWWWVGVVGERGGQEWESSSLFTGCCGRRGAVGENDGVGQFLCLQVAASLLDLITCNLSLCSECFDSRPDQTKRTAVMEALVCSSQREIYEVSLRNNRSRVLLFFTGSTKGSTSERRNGKEHRAAMGGSRWQQNNTNKN